MLDLGCTMVGIRVRPGQYGSLMEVAIVGIPNRRFERKTLFRIQAYAEFKRPDGKKAGFGAGTPVFADDSGDYSGDLKRIRLSPQHRGIASLTLPYDDFPRITRLLLASTVTVTASPSWKGKRLSLAISVGMYTKNLSYSRLPVLVGRFMNRPLPCSIMVSRIGVTMRLALKLVSGTQFSTPMW